MILAQILRQFSKGKGLTEVKFGACYNLHQALLDKGLSLDTRMELERQFKILYKAWPKYSGEYLFPVPGGEAVYCRTLNQWDGAYGDLRKELCTYVADQLEERYAKALLKNNSKVL